MKSLSHVRLFVTPWTLAYQAPPSIEFSRQEYWSGLPFPSPGDLPNPGIQPSLPYCRWILYQLSHQGSPLEGLMLKLKLQYFGHLMRRAGSLEKTLMLGKIEGRRRRGQQRARWLDSITNSWSLLKLMSIESVMRCHHFILCCPLLLLPSNYPLIRVFSNESVLCIRWPKYWSFSFSTSPSNEYSGLISFRMDWLDLLAVQEILKSLLQHHSSKVSILQCSAFFIVQLSHPYMTTGKTIAFTRWTFVGKVMSLLFNMLPMLVMTFLPRSKHLLISF